MKEQWIKDYVYSETTVARERVQATEILIVQEQGDMQNSEIVDLTTSKPEKIFEKMFNAVRDCLNDLACSDTEKHSEDKEDDEEATGQRTLSTDDKAHWVMGAITKTVQRLMESYQQ